MKYSRGYRKPLPAGARYSDQNHASPYVAFPWFGTVLILVAILAMILASTRPA